MGSALGYRVPARVVEGLIRNGLRCQSLAFAETVPYLVLVFHMSTALGHHMYWLL